MIHLKKVLMLKKNLLKPIMEKFMSGILELRIKILLLLCMVMEVEEIMKNGWRVPSYLQLKDFVFIH